MRIAIVTRDYHPRGGIERASQFYARGLRDRSHEVEVWSANVERCEKDSGITFHELKLPPLPAAARVLAFAFLSGRRIDAGKYDAVISMGAAFLGAGSFIVANSVHRQWFNLSRAALSPFAARWWLKTFNPLHPCVISIETLQYRRLPYRRVIAVSQPIKDELQSNYAVPPSRIDVLPNGMDFDRLKPDPLVRRSVRENLGVLDAEYLAVMAVNEFERKGLRQLIEALARVGSSKLKLLVVARPDPQPYRVMIERLNLQDRVIFAGPTNSLERFLWAADVYVLPTQYEAWNLSIGEALAAGLPVITTQLGQADTMISVGENGWLIKDPFDVDEIAACLRQWLAAANKNEMAEQARKRAADYSWERIVAKLEAIIKSG